MPRSCHDSDRVATTHEDRVRELRLSLEKRQLELGILSEVAARIHGVEDVQEILDIGLEEILAGLELKAAWVFMAETERAGLQLAASRGVSPAYLSQVKSRGLDECLCPEVFRSGHLMQVRNTTQCPRMPTIVDGLSEPVAHACVPLRFQGQRRGVLNVAARPGQLFSDEELRFFETLGYQLCVAVERGAHLRAERLRNREARALATITKAIGGSLDLPSILRAVGETARQIIGADELYILLGSDPRQATVGHVCGAVDAALAGARTVDLHAIGWRPALTALAERRLVRSDADASAERHSGRWSPTSGLAVPLVAHDTLLGVLLIGCAAPRRWSEEEIETTEALAAQASVALESARLYKEARRAYQDLKDAQQRTVQAEKMALLGTFASGLAHEVRNPLNSMTLQLSILERRLARAALDRSDEMKEIAGVIRGEIKRLDSLVGDFLLFSRTNRIQFVPASLDAVIDEVTRLLRPEARTAGITLRRQRVGEELPAIPIDGERMKQVMINLLRNAIEALTDGGHVVVESGLVDGRARIVVRDDGPGLPEGLDVFQLFVTSKDKGTGLGLSIAQQIVLEHGGEITASSAPGQGAVFTIALPLEPVEEPQPDRRPL
jgi:signal transduction histidine kinase